MYDLAYLVDLGLILISQKNNELIAAKSKNAQLFILPGKILKKFTYLFKKSVTIIVTIAVIYVLKLSRSMSITVLFSSLSIMPCILLSRLNLLGRPVRLS